MSRDDWYTKPLIAAPAGTVFLQTRHQDPLTFQGKPIVWYEDFSDSTALPVSRAYLMAIDVAERLREAGFKVEVFPVKRHTG